MKALHGLDLVPKIIIDSLLRMSTKTRNYFYTILFLNIHRYNRENTV